MPELSPESPSLISISLPSGPLGLVLEPVVKFSKVQKGCRVVKWMGPSNKYLSPGTEIHKVDSVSVRDKSFKEIVKMIKSSTTRLISLQTNSTTKEDAKGSSPANLIRSILMTERKDKDRSMATSMNQSDMLDGLHLFNTTMSAMLSPTQPHTQDVTLKSPITPNTTVSNSSIPIITPPTTTSNLLSNPLSDMEKGTYMSSRSSSSSLHPNEHTPCTSSLSNRSHSPVSSPISYSYPQSQSQQSKTNMAASYTDHSLNLSDSSLQLELNSTMGVSATPFKQIIRKECLEEPHKEKYFKISYDSPHPDSSIITNTNTPSPTKYNSYKNSPYKSSPLISSPLAGLADYKKHVVLSAQEQVLQLQAVVVHRENHIKQLINEIEDLKNKSRGSDGQLSFLQFQLRKLQQQQRIDKEISISQNLNMISNDNIASNNNIKINSPNREAWLKHWTKSRIVLSDLVTCLTFNKNENIIENKEINKNNSFTVNNNKNNLFNDHVTDKEMGENTDENTVEGLRYALRTQRRLSSLLEQRLREWVEGEIIAMKEKAESEDTLTECASASREKSSSAEMALMQKDIAKNDQTLQSRLVDCPNSDTMENEAEGLPATAPTSPVTDPETDNHTYSPSEVSNELCRAEERKTEDTDTEREKEREEERSRRSSSPWQLPPRRPLASLLDEYSLSSHLSHSCSAPSSRKSSPVPVPLPPRAGAGAGRERARENEKEDLSLQTRRARDSGRERREGHDGGDAESVTSSSTLVATYTRKTEMKQTVMSEDKSMNRSSSVDTSAVTASPHHSHRGRDVVREVYESSAISSLKDVQCTASIDQIQHQYQCDKENNIRVKEKENIPMNVIGNVVTEHVGRLKNDNDTIRDDIRRLRGTLKKVREECGGFGIN